MYLLLVDIPLAYARKKLMSKLDLWVSYISFVEIARIRFQENCITRIGSADQCSPLL